MHEAGTRKKQGSNHRPTFTTRHSAHTTNSRSSETEDSHHDAGRVAVLEDLQRLHRGHIAWMPSRTHTDTSLRRIRCEHFDKQHFSPQTHERKHAGPHTQPSTQPRKTQAVQLLTAVNATWR
jgi:hypothetical protein